MTTPFSIIDYDMDTKEKTVKKVEEVLGGHQPEDYVTERHWVSSRDGQKIPVSLVYKKTKLNIIWILENLSMWLMLQPILNLKPAHCAMPIVL